MIYDNSIKSYIINTKERRQRKIACDKTLRRLRLKSDYFIQPLNILLKVTKLVMFLL